MQPAISPLGDSALTITFGSLIDEAVNDQVFALFKHLKKQKTIGVKDVIPAYASLTIVYDVLAIRKISNGSAYQYMKDQTEKIISNLSVSTPYKNRVIEIPVCYDLSFGIDLTDMATEIRVSIEEIIEIHTSKKYRVYMIGFLPGFAYMGKVDEKIAAPRKKVPRTNIPAGSVGIAGEQTGIYPLDSPGGWNIIGQTPLKLFDAYSDNPCLLKPGDEVKFESISLSEFNELKEEQ